MITQTEAENCMTRYNRWMVAVGEEDIDGRHGENSIDFYSNFVFVVQLLKLGTRVIRSNCDDDDGGGDDARRKRRKATKTKYKRIEPISV